MKRLTRPTVKVDETAAKYMVAQGCIPTDLRSMNDRLLDLIINGPTLNGVNKDVLRQLIRQLYAALQPYEDTGMEPEQVKDNMEMFKAYRNVCDGMPPEYIAELFKLSKARAEGRLVVLPCKVGDTIWRIKCLGEWPDIGKPYVEADAFLYRDVHYFGKTVFLTREEAERALEGGTDNGN